MTLLATLRQRARDLKAEVFALYLVARHPATPWHARLVIAAVVAYAFSPIDLIPDFVPVLGYLDDLILVPLGIALAIKLVPPSILAECRVKAADTLGGQKPVSWVAGTTIVTIWLGVAVLGAAWAFRRFVRR